MSNHTVLIPSLLSNRVAQGLQFLDEGLMLEGKLGYAGQQFIPWENLVGIKLNARYINGLYIPIGQQYSIQLKTDDNFVYNIKLNSLYGIKKNLYRELWTDVFNLLFKYHFSNLLNYYIELHSIGQFFNLAGINIGNAGISWDNGPLVRWNEVVLHTYTRYIVISHEYHTEPRKFLYYGEDWNAYLLQYLLTHILSTKPGAIRKNSTQE